MLDIKVLLRLLIVVIFFVLILVMPKMLLAQNSQDIINQQDWITRQQQNILEDKARAKGLNLMNQKPAIKNSQEQDSSQNQINNKLQSCVIIKEINLRNAFELSNYRKNKLTQTFIGECLNPKIITQIVNSLSDYYHRRGFVTTQITIPNQNIMNGILELQIIQGKIEKITFGKERLIDKMQKFMAFGNFEDKVLNINDINQGIYQINRLQSNQAIVKIEPSSQNNKSVVKIDNKKSFPAKLMISHDNLGNNFTGVERVNLSTSLDNLLSLNDNFDLNYTTNINDKKHPKNIKSFNSNLIIPYKFSNLSFDYSHSTFKGQNSGNVEDSILTGFSQSSKITLDKMLINQDIIKFSTNISLNTKSSASYLNNTKIENSQRKLSILNFGITSTFNPNKYFSLYISPSYSKGLKLMNAKKDFPNSQNEVPKAQFDVLKIYTNFSSNFKIPLTNISTILSSEINCQYAKQTLYGSEQISIGGYHSVRGFRENYINGDSGYYLRNKINFNFASLVPNSLVDSPNSAPDHHNFVTKNYIHLNKFALEPFYDYGYVKNKYIDNGADGRLAGAGVKGLFNSKYFNASLTYSWATNKSQLINSTFKENKLIYFEISANCC